jgi:DNA-binding NarL/FixJ family response regulator
MNVSHIRVIVVEDDQMIRELIATWLGGLENVIVVAVAADGLSALEAVSNFPADLMVIDVAIPKLNGVDLVRELRRTRPSIKSIILTAHPDYLNRAIEAGAFAYLLKSSGLDELQVALTRVMSGRKYISSELSEFIFLESNSVGANETLKRLTARQRQILQLIAEGYATKEIADLLGIEVKTADRHRTELMHRLDLHNVANLTRFAIRAALFGQHASFCRTPFPKLTLAWVPEVTQPEASQTIGLQARLERPAQNLMANRNVMAKSRPMRTRLSWVSCGRK